MKNCEIGTMRVDRLLRVGVGLQGEAFYKRVKPLFDAASVAFETELFTTHAGHARQVSPES